MREVFNSTTSTRKTSEAICRVCVARSRIENCNLHLLSFGFSATTGADEEAGAEAGADAEAPALAIRSLMLRPLRALAKRPGQYPSTELALALMTLFNFSSVISSSPSWRRRAA